MFPAAMCSTLALNPPPPPPLLPLLPLLAHLLPLLALPPHLQVGDFEFGLGDAVLLSLEDDENKEGEEEEEEEVLPPLALVQAFWQTADGGREGQFRLLARGEETVLCDAGERSGGTRGPVGAAAGGLWRGCSSRWHGERGRCWGDGDAYGEWRTGTHAG